MRVCAAFPEGVELILLLVPVTIPRLTRRLSPGVALLHQTALCGVGRWPVVLIAPALARCGRVIRVDVKAPVLK